MESMGMAMATYTGQNYGAGRLDRVRRGIRDGLLIQGAYGLAAGTGLFLLKGGLARLVLGADGGAVYAMAVQYITVVSTQFVLHGALMILRNTLQGLGHSGLCLLYTSYTPGASYVHICENNTIYGTRYTKLPQVPGVPLVADMSSCILSRPTDVTKYGALYFGVQKNVAPAGMAVVVVRRDLLGRARPDTPAMLDWKTIIDADSMYNTPPCWCIYMMGLVLDWIEREVGGLAAMEARNEQKAALLYDYLDGSSFFRNPVRKADRSIMNVTFTAPTKELDAKFCAEAAQAGFVNLKGHRSVGGMRASIYNAMPAEGVEKLTDFMRAFEKANG